MTECTKQGGQSRRPLERYTVGLEFLSSRRGHLAAAAAAVLTLAAGWPSLVAAQTQVALSAHASRDFALPAAPYLYGGSLATYTGIVGVRLGGALGELRDVQRPDGDTRLELGAWTADADLILAPAQNRATRAALGGLGPYAFIGIGTQGVRREVLGAREGGPVWSYGGGLAQPLLGVLYLDAEARYRLPIIHDGEQIPPGFVRAWEYRLGLSLRFGGDRGRRRGGHRGDWDRAREP